MLGLFVLSFHSSSPNELEIHRFKFEKNEQPGLAKHRCFQNIWRVHTRMGSRMGHDWNLKTASLHLRPLRPGCLSLHLRPALPLSTPSSFLCPAPHDGCVGHGFSAPSPALVQPSFPLSCEYLRPTCGRVSCARAPGLWGWGQHPHLYMSDRQLELSQRQRFPSEIAINVL